MWGLVLAAAMCVVAGQQDALPEAVPLWPGGAPGAKGTGTGEARNPGDVPTLTIFAPPAGKSKGAAVVICPGGGYGMLAVDHEGFEVARWLNSMGVTAGVLRYRLGPKYQHPAPLQDAQRAIRTMRSRAKELGVDPKRVGIMGFSAGGHLASTAATHFDGGDLASADVIEHEGSRPDFAILIYPVIALATEYGHAGSRRNLLGESPSPEVVRGLSNETQVSKETPAVFLAHTNEDKGVPPENSLLFAMACRKAGVPLELHVFEKGGHGLGLGTGSREFGIAPERGFSAWPKLCEQWMRGRGILDVEALAGAAP